MDVESRDSVSLKPAELDELGQLASSVGLPLQDEQLDRHVEQFPLVAIAVDEGELHGFLFGSLERIGGTPCILWGLGGDPPGPTGPAEPRRARRRAVPPGGDLVPRRGRARRRAGSRTRPPTRCSRCSTTCARARSTRPTARSGPGAAASPAASAATPATTTGRSGSPRHGAPELVLDARTVKAGGKVAAELVGEVDPAQRRGGHRLRLGDGRGPRRRPRHPADQPDVSSRP